MHLNSTEKFLLAKVLSLFTETPKVGRRVLGFERIHSVHPGPAPVPAFFTRGRESSLMEVCPQFRNSDAPVIFHLPKRTALRVLETVNLKYIGPIFAENGKSCFGLNSRIVAEQLPRWTGHSDIERASVIATFLCKQIIANPAWLPVSMLPRIINVSGEITVAGLISSDITNEIVKEILPRCLERSQLNSIDVLDLLRGVSKLKADSTNSAVFPLIANFAAWFLERRMMNRLKRNRRIAREKRVRLQIESDLQMNVTKVIYS